MRRSIFAGFVAVVGSLGCSPNSAPPYACQSCFAAAAPNGTETPFTSAPEAQCPNGMAPMPVRASWSSTVTMSPHCDDLLAVNPMVDGLVIEQPGGGILPLFGVFPPQSRPSSVAGGIDDTAYVTLRATGQLARIVQPTAVATTTLVNVGAEPTGVAVSPNGKYAVVALFGEPAAAIVDTSSLTVRKVALMGQARAVAITNNGDGNDDDEHAYVTIFYGEPVAEGSDTGRIGHVAELSLKTATVTRVFTASPIADTGFSTATPLVPGSPVGCSPNQLSAEVIADGRLYVAHICVSPEAPQRPDTTAFAAVSVFDLASGNEVKGADGTFVVPKLFQNAPTGFVPSMFADPVGLALSADGKRLHVLSRGADRIATVSIAPGSAVSAVFTLDGGLMPGADGGDFGCSGYNGCFGDDGGIPPPEIPNGVPNGIAISARDGRVVVNDWSGMALREGREDGSHLPADFHDVSYEPFAPQVTFDQRLGIKFFFTAQNKWSQKDALACGSCHPDGLSDGVTWAMSAGPRQTLPLDGTFTKNDANDHRVQNWTGNLDEVYDVEGLVRNTMGGFGAITDPMGQQISLSAGLSVAGGPVTRNDGLSGSTKNLVTNLSVVHDWERIEAFVQQIPTPRAPTPEDPDAVSRGRVLFATAGCDSCHSGPKWTLSHVPYTPSPQTNGSLVGDNSLPSAPTGLRTQLRATGPIAGVNEDSYKIAPERLLNPDGGAAIVIGPERITCVLRTVGTFDAQDPLEKKADGTRAQGALGFNPPSLLGVGSSAPYFHNGAAKTLEEVFAPRFLAHARAGSSAFLPNGGATADEQSQIHDLVAFLKTIDGTTTPFLLRDDLQLCAQY